MRISDWSSDVCSSDLSSQFVGLDNFAELFSNSDYVDSFKVTALFSVLVAVLGLSISLLLAVMADRVVKAAGVYKTLLIWPYAVATAVAGVLWLFLFSPSVGRSEEHTSELQSLM